MDLSNTQAAQAAPAVEVQHALDILNEAWAYYSPEPAIVQNDEEPDLFEYYAAA
ncbi:hypothetical protein [Marinibacterium profundimaris]|uniref:hypothetical protein n=1 Tax=Marinibacterium profundimaris TaxID=1679460 RepID=UPI0018E975E4|nr:hypothetical protein [Marinibacterium profundimaris]